MVRRLGFLSLLFVALTAFMPLGWACAAVAEVTDCCPDGQPCEQPEPDAVAGVAAAACCELPRTAPTAIAAITKQKTLAAASHTGTAVPTSELPRVLRALGCSLNHDRPGPLFAADQHLLYLVTGRLRL